MLRRIYERINKPGKFALIVDSIDLFWDFNEKWKIFETASADLSMDPSVDVEAEFVSQYCLNYVEDLKKRGII